MAYKGRGLGLGLTEEGNPAAVYFGSGRSPSSKKRVARFIDDDCIKRVHIGPLGEMDEEQKRKANLFFYDGIWTIDDIGKGLPYLVVSNGVHTDTIRDVTLATPDVEDILMRTLRLFGPEPDSLKTPRIAGEIRFQNIQKPYIVPSLAKDNTVTEPCATLGIITEKGSAMKPYFLKSLEKGKFKMISTYTGKDDANPKAPDLKFTSGIESIIENVELKGRCAGELAASLRKTMDPNLFVWAAAAVYTGRAWDLCEPENLNEVKA